MKKQRNPYGNTKKRKAALAFLAARGITQPRALYPAARFVDETAIKARDSVRVRKSLTLVS